MVVGLSAFPALAQTGAPKSFTFVSGDCVSLTVLDSDITTECQGSVVLSEYTNGRVNIAFVLTSDRGLFSFSGDQAEQVLDADAVTQPIDSLLMLEAGAAAPRPRIMGTGECRWGDPFAGPARIDCRFRAPDGAEAKAAFLTDGAEPDVVTP